MGVTGVTSGTRDGQRVGRGGSQGHGDRCTGWSVCILLENAEVWRNPTLKKMLLFYVKFFFFLFTLLNLIILEIVSSVYKVVYKRIS